MSIQTKPVDTVPETYVPTLLPKLDLSSARTLATAFKALADPTRVRIVWMLLDTDKRELCVCDIALNFPLGQPTISHHLKSLKNAGLVRSRKEGLRVFYSVNRERLALLGIALPVPRLPTERSQCFNEGCENSLDEEKCNEATGIT